MILPALQPLTSGRQGSALLPKLVLGLMRQDNLTFYLSEMVFLYKQIRNMVGTLLQLK